MVRHYSNENIREEPQGRAADVEALNQLSLAAEILKIPATLPILKVKLKPVYITESICS